jgi:hypothetical protein
MGGVGGGRRGSRAHQALRREKREAELGKGDGCGDAGEGRWGRGACEQVNGDVVNDAGGSRRRDRWTIAV